MNRPTFPRHQAPSSSFVRVNGKIRAREVRIVGVDGKQLGVYPLAEAINLARASGVDLVEVAPNATPPVCRLVDFGKYRYEQSKKDKDAKKHQHANRVKEVQLSPNIDPHDFTVKLSHAVDFLCEDMKVKISLRFRGREMAHTEIGFQVVNKFIEAATPYGHPDAPPKLMGRSINLMISPLPRNKRAKHPNEQAGADDKPVVRLEDLRPEREEEDSADNADESERPTGFTNNPFDALDAKFGQ